MGTGPNKTSAEACRPLADAILNIRKAGIVSEQWIARALEEALSTHQWQGQGRAFKPGLGRRIAKLVYTRQDRDALSKSLAGLIRHDRVAVRAKWFFSTSGLAETGIPVDHTDAGRNVLMGSLISRFVYGRSPDYQAELERQGSYTLLQNAGQNQVNRSLLCVDALSSNGVMWALHLYRKVGDQADMLRSRVGVFLPETRPLALLSASGWIDSEPLVNKHFDDEAASAVLKALRKPSQSRSDWALTSIRLNAGKDGEVTDSSGREALGYLKTDGRLGITAFERVGLNQRDSLSEEERAVTDFLSARQFQALADAGEVLARFTANDS
ncbi:hypothetical protein GCM10007420_22060 [Glycocaulis albus]|uniref:Uncharacterized protein n=1 Tax=Glycocaulis albus TaxID=1382801 RepID=A0ABQ1XWN1_9PROT|nr:hypothetical protein [Glycocaulis albus]GGH05178.1 hypothetical protein GCM10007420_22060 [Glycocaulis albus]